jgi:hypothetical protein
LAGDFLAGAFFGAAFLGGAFLATTTSDLQVLKIMRQIFLKNNHKQTFLGRRFFSRRFLRSCCSASC